MAKICFDYGAGMPVDERVMEEMKPYFFEKFGNPSSIHSLGWEAKEALEGARKKVAGLVNGEEKNTIFTSGATEANSLAIKGVALQAGKGHVITTRIEHVSVLHACEYLEKKGFRITYLPVDKFGSVDAGALESALAKDTVLISVGYANAEIGTIQPIKEIGKIASSKNIPLHVDAVAAGGKIPVDVKGDGIDLLSLSSNSMYGPKGVGALYVNAGVKLEPLFHGGWQEKGMRAGSENVPGAVGFGKAAEIVKAEMGELGKKLGALRDRLIGGITSSIKYAYLNGHPASRLPDNANIRFAFIEGESLVLTLDMMGVLVASGSACTSKTLEPSHVLTAIGVPLEEANGSLVFSFGKQNSQADVDKVIEILPSVVKRLRAMSPLTPKEVL